MTNRCIYCGRRVKVKIKSDFENPSSQEMICENCEKEHFEEDEDEY